MNRPIRLAVFTTHPIQYQVPWFRALAEKDEVKLIVHYSFLPGPEQQGQGFGKAFEWDLPLLGGYDWRLVSQSESSQNTRTTRLAHAVAAHDVVLVTGWNHPFLVRTVVAAAWRRKPLVVRGESNAMRSRPVPVRMLHAAYLQLFDTYLYIGHSNRHFYRAYRVPDTALYPCRYFVENRRFDADRQRLGKDRAQFRARWRIPEQATCFLFAGKLIGKKQPFAVLHAMARLNGEKRGLAHLLVVGDGNFKSEMEAYAKVNGLPVTFAGFLNQTQIGEAYTAADVLVLPSDYGETWGLVVNEGMLFGLPAIVSDRVGCGPDLVEDGITGYTFPFGRVDSLGRAMERMCSDPEHRTQMGEVARERVLQYYSVEAAADGTVEAVKAAFAKRRR